MRQPGGRTSSLSKSCWTPSHIHTNRDRGWRGTRCLPAPRSESSKPSAERKPRTTKPFRDFLLVLDRTHGPHIDRCCSFTSCTFDPTSTAPGSLLHLASNTAFRSQPESMLVWPMAEHSTSTPQNKNSRIRSPAPTRESLPAATTTRPSPWAMAMLVP